MTAAQQEHYIDAVSFIIEKLGCGPEVRTVLDHVQQLEQRVDYLEDQISDMIYQESMRASYAD